MSGDGYTLSFAYPYGVDIGNAEDYDETSSVVWLDYMGVSAIFMGDAEMDTENSLMREDSLGLLKEFGVDLQSTEILKVGHHGSETSTSLEFLQYLKVKTAVISCGENNRHGHPTETVLGNISSAGAGVYRTDLDGTVMISIKSAAGYEVSRSK